MYAVDDRDRVVPLGGIPQSSIGAPIPLVVADEITTCIAFYCENPPPGWNGDTVRVIDSDSDEPWAIVTFTVCFAHMFGPPNDEAFAGHPLAARGLAPYGAYAVAESSWLRTLERMNSVHPQHDRERYLRARHHMILTFHDSTFECIAAGYHVRRGKGPLVQTVPIMAEHLKARPSDLAVPMYPRG